MRPGRPTRSRRCWPTGCGCSVRTTRTRWPPGGASSTGGRRRRTADQPRRDCFGLGCSGCGRAGAGPLPRGCRARVRALGLWKFQGTGDGRDGADRDKRDFGRRRQQSPRCMPQGGSAGSNPVGATEMGELCPRKARTGSPSLCHLGAEPPDPHGAPVTCSQPRQAGVSGLWVLVTSGSVGPVYAVTDLRAGRERYVCEAAGTCGAAEVALTRLRGQVDEDRHPKSAVTLGPAVAQWLEVAKLEDTTCERDEDLIRIYIGPTFGDLAAGKLDAELLERFYARLQRCRTLCNGRPSASHTCRPLSSSSVRKIHFIISAALERAVRWRHLGVSRAALVVVPASAQTEPDPPTVEEAARILSEAWAVEPEWGLLLWLTMVTGSRRGEVSALRWRDLDSARGLLVIRRSNAHPKAGVKEKETKTRQQRRVALDPQTLELLTVHRGRWEQRCADLGCELEPTAYLFSPAPDGSTPWPPRSLTQRYGRLAKKLKLRSTRLHSLRHYSATELIAAGVDIAPSPAASATAAAAPPPSRSTPPGWTKPAANEPPAPWPASCPSSPPVIDVSRGRRSVVTHRTSARPDATREVL